MKALGFSLSVFVLASLAAPPTEAHFRAVFHAPGRIGPTHGRDFRGEFHRRRGRSDGGLGFIPLDVPPDAAPPQYEPVPVPVPVPYGFTRWTRSEPRLILLGKQERPHGAMPKVVYGDPLPEEGARP